MFGRTSLCVFCWACFGEEHSFFCLTAGRHQVQLNPKICNKFFFFKFSLRAPCDKFLHGWIQNARNKFSISVWTQNFLETCCVPQSRKNRTHAQRDRHTEPQMEGRTDTKKRGWRKRRGEDMKSEKRHHQTAPRLSLSLSVMLLISAAYAELLSDVFL